MKCKIICKIYLKNGHVLKEAFKVKKSDMRAAVAELDHITDNIGDPNLSAFCVGNTSVCQTEVAAIMIKQKYVSNTVQKIG